MKFLILCVVVASFFVVSFGHNLEVSSSQKVSLLRHGLNKRMRKSDLESIKGIGPSTARLLNDKGITLNRNAIPFDPRSPFITSGIRMGTPAVTTCGMKEKEMKEVGHLISEILKSRNDDSKLQELETKVRDIAKEFQPYG